MAFVFMKNTIFEIRVDIEPYDQKPNFGFADISKYSSYFEEE